MSKVEAYKVVGRLMHLVLLGDSIFDNGSYVPGGPALIDQIRQGLDPEDTATLLAMDGSISFHVQEQAERIPAEATHLFLSVGGNDALGNAYILRSPVDVASEAFTTLAEIQTEFAQYYSDAVCRLIETGLPTVICTIYDQIPFRDPLMRTMIPVGLSVCDILPTLTLRVQRGLPFLTVGYSCPTPLI